MLDISEDLEIKLKNKNRELEKEVALIEGISFYDNLNLYLVMNGLKDSSLISLKAKRDKDNSRAYFPLSNDKIEYFQKSLDKLKVQNYRYRNKEFISGNYEYVEFNNFLVAGSNNQLNCLKKVLESEEKNNYKIGLALGFPEASSREFSRMNVSKQVFKNDLEIKNADIEDSLWFAYISFVPYNLHENGGKLYGDGRELGKKYQKFVRENNPNLAHAIEMDFKFVNEKFTLEDIYNFLNSKF